MRDKLKADVRQTFIQFSPGDLPGEKVSWPTAILLYAAGMAAFPAGKSPAGKTTV